MMYQNVKALSLNIDTFNTRRKYIHLDDGLTQCQFTSVLTIVEFVQGVYYGKL